jgi:hypothetical protein
VFSQEAPDQQASVDCILTVAAFSEFSSELRPKQFDYSQTAQIVVKNLSNIQDTFIVNFQSQADALLFERLEYYQLDPSANGQSPTRVAMTEIREPLSIFLPAGETGPSISAPDPLLPFLGGETTYPFTVVVQSTDSTDATRDVIGRALIPVWVCRFWQSSLYPRYVCLLSRLAGYEAARKRNTNSAICRIAHCCRYSNCGFNRPRQLLGQQDLMAMGWLTIAARNWHRSRKATQMETSCPMVMMSIAQHEPACFGYRWRRSLR